MIYRFIEIVPNKLYRGSAPSPKDVLLLKNNFNINKIISLDEESGNRINRACHLLNIKHIMLPIDAKNIKLDLLTLFKHDLKKLLLDDGPTFIHCYAGKDRTGLLSAIFECKYLGTDPEKAIKKAKSLGFGQGVDPKIINLFEKIIKSCSPSKDSDVNNSSIVQNNREYISDNRDTFLDESRMGSFAPYLSPTRQNPVDALYSYINEQSPTRTNYKSVNPFLEPESNVVPLVGIFNNDAGARGFGPVENYSGFFYD